MSEIAIEDIVIRCNSTEDVSESGGAENAGGGGSGALELGRRLLGAARDGDTQLVLDLMARGAPFTSDWLGTSPLHLAAANNAVGVCGVLLRAGVSRDCRNKVRRTPLHLAAYWGHTAAAAALLQHGAYVEPRDMLGMTPLHWAAERGHAAVAELLVRRGADPGAVCRFMRTPRSLAAPHPAVRAALEVGKDPDVEIHPETEFVEAVENIETEETHPVETPEKENDEPQSEEAESETRGGAAGGAESGEESGAARLLRRHGITLLEADRGSTVLSALQSGRTVLLSDAGKLLLKDSSPAAAAAAPVTAPASPAAAPAPGKVTIKKIIHPGDVQVVKYVPVCGRVGARPSASACPSGAARPAPRPAVVVPAAQKSIIKLQRGGAALTVPARYVHSTDPEYLRTQLLHAHAALHALRAQVAALSAQLRARDT